MRKLISVLMLFVFLTACSGNTNLPGRTPKPTSSAVISQPSSTPSPLLELKVSDYFPLAKDVHKKYKGTGNEYAEFETYVDYVQNDTIQLRNINGGTISVNVYQLKNGILKKTFSQGETYYRYDYTSSINQDEILIKEPIKLGTTWTLKDGASRSITGVDKQINTPFANFKALEITTKRQESIIKDYYAKDMGLVKSEYNAVDNSFSITSELEKVENNVPYKQSIRLYFPDFMNDRIVYIERAVESYTNEDMKLWFQKELKIIPGNSELTKVLSANTSILGCKLDEKNGIVTVDFSAHLVKEMNVGTSLESMLLKCITNTFGQYYQKEKVIITIEGKPYESGHILMKPGEYFKVKTDGVMEYTKQVEEQG